MCADSNGSGMVSIIITIDYLLSLQYLLPLMMVGIIILLHFSNGSGMVSRGIALRLYIQLYHII